MVMPVSDWYLGATFFRGASSLPLTAAITSFDGLFEVPVLVPHAARMAGSEVNAALVTAVRLTNSRRVIRCIPFPPPRLSVPLMRRTPTIVLRSGCHDNWFLRLIGRRREGKRGSKGTDG